MARKMCEVKATVEEIHRLALEAMARPRLSAEARAALQQIVHGAMTAIRDLNEPVPRTRAIFTRVRRLIGWLIDYFRRHDGPHD